MKTNSLEYINVAFEVKVIHEDENDEFFIFEGLASTFGNIDEVDDIVVRGAFKESLIVKTPVILWQHSAHEPIGMPIEIREVEEGLFIKARLPKADTFVSGRVIPQIKIGSIRSMSIGFRTVEREFNDEGIRLLKKVDLLEVSLVTFPANPLAAVSGFKSVPQFKNLPLAPRNLVWDEKAAIARIKTETGSTESPSDSYRDAFLWVDSENAKDFGSYKLPFVDVIDGALTSIHRALNSAKSNIDQADISEDDKSQVLANIERYQAKLDDEQPKQFFNVGCVKQFDKRELEKALRESGAFSSKAAVFISKDFTGQGELVGDVDDIKKMLAGLTAKADDHIMASEISNIKRKASSYGSLRDQRTE